MFSNHSRAVFASALLGGLALVPSLGAQSVKPVHWQHTDATLTWAPCPPIFPKGCEVAVLHGDPAAGPSDVFLRIPSDYTFPSHTHTSAEHIVLVKGVLHVFQPGGAPAEMKEGSFGLLTGKQAHGAHCAGSAGCVLFIHFDSPIDAALATQP